MLRFSYEFETTSHFETSASADAADASCASPTVLHASDAARQTTIALIEERTMPKKATKTYNTKLKKAAWHVIATKNGFVVKKVRDPRIKGAVFAFGPYKTKKKACGVARYQTFGVGANNC
jgi:hypothetical protein